MSAHWSQLACFVCAGIMPGWTVMDTSVMDTCGLSAVHDWLKFFCLAFQGAYTVLQYDRRAVGPMEISMY